jgi:TolB protein
MTGRAAAPASRTPLRTAAARRLLLIGAAATLAPGVTTALVAPAASAQRAPVLQQIRVPHPYYYREMFLPQVTSGPNAVTWSPDGTELVHAMQGSLWRQRLDDATAEQLTAGPGYDHQPDWSPDGRYVAYASYRNDAVELWLLDVASGEARAIVANGAVNVEPRWAPDGRRIAFVSTQHEGRFHIYTVAVDDAGRAGVPQRLTEDRNSGLPRYYYSVYDHYLSPTWSPDGRELILISNRGRIWGSGGFWRMEARAGAPLREIHYEETTWKARPDWSPDGRRVVYSSYLGRQWHQLWLMPDEGGDVFPLTYGEFDATSPRWAPDGGAIAYISNEHGNTSLWVVEIPGGRRRHIEIRERRYREPVGRVRVSVVDAAGVSVPARISVTAADGRGFVPHAAWRHADDGFDRRERAFEHSYFHAAGPAEIDVPAGRVTVEVTRGLEHAVWRRQLDVGTGELVDVPVSLQRISDLRARGWRSGDLHVHMNYGGAYRATPATLALQAAAEDLDVVENQIVNKEQRIPDVDRFTGRPEQIDGVTINHGQEFHTSFWGHVGLLGLREHLVLPDYAGYANTAAASLYPHNVAVAELARRQGGLVGYVHPFEGVPDPGDRSVPLTNELPVGVALGKVDYLEVVAFSDHPTTAEVWYRLLNTGFRVPAGAGTDAMTNFASLRGPVGMNRVFVSTGGDTSYAAFLDGIRAGRTFVTNGPLVELTVNGRGPGAELDLPAGRQRLRLQGTLRSIVPVDHLQVVRNGVVVAELPLAGDRTSHDFDMTIDADASGWYTLRAWNEEAVHPVLDDYRPFATTSPVYVILGGRPIRNREHAAYFVAWIDRLDEAARAHDGWNTGEEKEQVLRSIADARRIFSERAAAP